MELPEAPKLHRKVAETLAETCPAKRHGRRCKFVAGHDASDLPAEQRHPHQDKLGKVWPESRKQRKVRLGK